MKDLHLPADVFPTPQGVAASKNASTVAEKMMMIDDDSDGAAVDHHLPIDDDSDDDLYAPYPPDGLVHRSYTNITSHITPPQKIEVDPPALVPVNSKKGGGVSRQNESVPPPSPPDLDLSHDITGMYRILDLISEQGSGGLVDKIIISQDSLRAFINTICPGAYASLTKVDFKALDKLTVKPIGVYGSREEIARFLSSIGAVDEDMMRKLISHKDDLSGVSGPTLRSGLYLVRSSTPKLAGEVLYVLYWPEDTTWDDSAVSSTRRNRVTFMRYLLKVCDQTIALISSKHAEAIIWNKDDEDDDPMDPDHNESDRLFTFEVEKTNEQEETVTTRPGFQMISRDINTYTPSDASLNPDQFLPKLLMGETIQGFMTSRHRAARTRTEPIPRSFMNDFQFRNILRQGGIRLSEQLNEDDLDLLVNFGLRSRFPEPCERWFQVRGSLREASQSERDKDVMIVNKDLDRHSALLEAAIEGAMVNVIMARYPSIAERFTAQLSGNKDGMKDIESLAAIYPSFNQFVIQPINDVVKSSNIKFGNFKERKERFIAVNLALQRNPYLDQSKRQELIELIFDDGDMQVAGTVFASEKDVSAEAKSKTKGFWNWSVIRSFWPDSDETTGQKLSRGMRDDASHVRDAEFLTSLKEATTREPLLSQAVVVIEDILHDYLTQEIKKATKKLTNKAVSIQQQDYKRQIDREVAHRLDQDLRIARLAFVRGTNTVSSQGQHAYIHVINSVEESVAKGYHSYSYNSAPYRLTGTRETLEQPTVEYSIRVLSLTTQDQHTMQLDSKFVPSPQDRFSHTFSLPVGQTIVHAQLLQNDRVLLVVVDRPGNLFIFLEAIHSIDGAITRSAHKTKLNRDKIGQDFILAYDESKRMLAVCASAQLVVHVFVFDESYKSLQALGSAIKLLPWYNYAASICRACFVLGSEELLLVDSSAQARIFSLMTQQFRPATVQLPQIPTAVYSSPDGSCLLTAQANGPFAKLTAYHWSTFGSTEGIALDIPNLPVENGLVLTSLGSNKNSVHLVALDVFTHLCQSYALDITRKATEFTFQQKGIKSTSDSTQTLTLHNCILECHAEVWTRFPVVPAVQRQTITVSSTRHRKKLLFITDRDHPLFSSHFVDMIKTFERATRKPTGDELKNILVSAIPFSAMSSLADWEVSQFRVGEWLVDFLCLIPIHIAITKENRFIPLKDGVSSPELEKSLLGAEVGQVVDSLSFGWYESLFQSYMASKPVRVVSSMGEQSVGKSFCLNHLVDTSFAGSAMRTTEGVWMSVTPTQDALIVALDFEGVHSIERSAQEDTLLVLFNTAISNLVLFRNNFALSRDIAGLFQSFQSSSTVLDPAANPTLFQSTLVIIIKDVVDSDKSEITREFSLKFQRIVQEEQDANFISKLHAGKLNIIPWPVIESREFYRLFPTLKKRLDQQLVTHRTAGEFLHTLKTLMAKLKTNDWGALSQTMAAHRAQLLLSFLPNALATGFGEVEPELLPLKNFDTDIEMAESDTGAVFSLLASGDSGAAREIALASLRDEWEKTHPRQRMPDADWTSTLAVHLDDLADMRLHHVREWIKSNLSRFQTGHANIEELRRTLEATTVDLRTNIQLCVAQCGSCHLLCVQSRLHKGLHDCRTMHQCIHNCDFCDEVELRACNMSAGHPGKHICVVTDHLCGKPCGLIGKQGCLNECTKMIGHAEEDHMCSASLHSCSESCALVNIKLADGALFSCPGTCRISCDEMHDQHICDARHCPATCQLCNRLCSNQDHLHGLKDTAVHLCGQEHSCTALCAAPGICEIDTAPHSIEATFTGKHETFQYTKYSQVAKRLKCIKPILSGTTSHVGAHIHSLDEKVFHFCEKRCESCGYVCTLPRGHSQKQHETRHGSMSQTRWAVEGPLDSSLELEGRRFSSNDEGAPMMCNLVCQAMGRHVHIDYCRAESDGACQGSEVQHIPSRMVPNPDRKKDAVTHNLHWQRTGFKDPYSRDDQTNFAKCDAMCSGPEHTTTAMGPTQSSYCTLAMFHAPMNSGSPLQGLGYVSQDGHHFSCKNPVVMQQAFHVIFAIDRSGSMSCKDRRPLANSPATNTIAAHSNNRLGAVLSSLYSFWSARNTAVTAGQQNANRRDSYSVVLFDHTMANGLTNDFTSSPDQLLAALLPYKASGGTDFGGAIKHVQTIMEQNWSTERTPVVIFLSDGECSVSDQIVQDICRSAVRLGKPLSFHSVSFGPDRSSPSLRRMAQIAQEVQNNAPRDPLAPAETMVLSSYSEALDTVRLAETFLGIAESLRKPRGSLLR